MSCDIHTHTHTHTLLSGSAHSNQLSCEYASTVLRVFLSVGFLLLLTMVSWFIPGLVCARSGICGFLCFPCSLCAILSMLMIGVLAVVAVFWSGIHRGIGMGQDTECSVGLNNFALAMTIILSFILLLFWCGCFGLMCVDACCGNPTYSNTQGSTMEEGRIKEKEQGTSTAVATEQRTSTAVATV